MGKSLFLMILSSIIGLITSSEFLSASDVVDVTRLNDKGIVETVPLPEPETAIETNYQFTSQSNVQAVASTRKTTAAAKSTALPNNSIAITGKTLAIREVGSTTVDSGYQVNKYGAKFLYGHNISAVFGGLAGLGVGSTFTVNYGGVTTNYRVANVVTFEKNVENGKLQLNGKGSYMNAVSRAVHLGTNYDISLMTCAGTMYGNGDASHRLVIFANAI